jgi:hypothetical protein
VGGKEKKRKKEKGINPFAAKLKLKVLWKLPAPTTRYPGLIESEP